MMKTLLEVGLKIQEILTVAPKLCQVVAKLKNMVKQRDFSVVGGVLQVRIISQMIDLGYIILGDLKGMLRGEESTLENMAQGTTGTTHLRQDLTIPANQWESTDHILATAYVKVIEVTRAIDMRSVSTEVKLSVRVGKEVMRRQVKEMNQRRRCL